MKRVREEEEEAGGQEKPSFALRDVPCVHAGHMRRLEFWNFRDRCLQLHMDRERIRKRAQDSARLLKTDARSIVAHDLVLGRLGPEGRGLPKDELDAELLRLEASGALVATAERVLKRIDDDDVHRFNVRVANLRLTVKQACASKWTQTAVGFKRHLYQSQCECECFLCIDPVTSLESESRVSCYLCTMRPSQRDEATVSSWHSARMCSNCCTLAQKRGLCAFCWGHVDASGTRCGGREDFRRERAAVNALSESSALDIF